MASLIRSPVGGYYGQWSLQSEVEHGFRGQLDLLTLGGCLYSATQPTAGCGANCGSLAASGDRANDGSDACTCADFFSGIFAA